MLHRPVPPSGQGCVEMRRADHFAQGNGPVRLTGALCAISDHLAREGGYVCNSDHLVLEWSVCQSRRVGSRQLERPCLAHGSQDGRHREDRREDRRAGEEIVGRRRRTWFGTDLLSLLSRGCQRRLHLPKRAAEHDEAVGGVDALLREVLGRLLPSAEEGIG
eukprot:scaffold12774_cov153-Isochrysis_galbana.AAC.3